MTTMTNFRGIDMLGATPNDAAKPKPEPKAKPAPEPTPEPEAVGDGPEHVEAVPETPDEDEDEVPSGNAVSVLEWVDNDKDRAGQALAKEKTRENPRKVLSSDLEDIINK